MLKPPKFKKTKAINADITTKENMFTDLRQVMDYKRPLSIFYSGVEYGGHLDILYDLGIRNFLMSYEYLKDRGYKQLKRYPDIHLFIDSGAYTYQVDPQYESYTVEMWEEHIVKYLEWVKKHKDSIFAIADLDLQYLPAVGYDTVYEWRKKYFEPFMLETGVPVCMIYHDDGLDVWERMCQRYPYVGMSLMIDRQQEDSENTLREMFRIAEKYNTLCQGMASTNTRLLVDYPFFTVDSSTWNIGLKYGEISVWTGQKMSRVKKDEFETKAFPLIERYDIPFDFELIRKEDKTEMVRVNAYAFVQAEKYIHERLKARMYWLKAKTTKIDIYDLPEDFFPSPQWFYTNMPDVKEYAVKMNINPEYEKVNDLVYETVAFMTWDNTKYQALREKYEFNSSLLTQAHDLWVNRIVSDDEARINDLRKFFEDCVSGDNDKLLQIGTNFDRIAKERENYIEEENTVLVDMSEQEVRERLKDIIPTEKDFETEITGLDDEVYKKADIVPVRNEHGVFVKGMKSLRQPKKVYSKKFPKFVCDTCLSAQRCPEYRAGYVCAYQKVFGQFETRDLADVIQGMQGIVDHNMTRMQRAMLMEVINGINDPTVSNMMNQNMAFLNTLAKLYEVTSNDFMKFTKVTRADGSTEESAVISNPQDGGILAKLFSGLNAKNNAEEIIEVKPVTEKDKAERYKNIEED